MDCVAATRSACLATLASLLELSLRSLCLRRATLILNSLQARLGDDFSVVYPAAQGKRMTQMLGNYTR
jgi:hypothetical protein